MQTTPQKTKISKTTFNCYHCRLATPRREGNWFDWDGMQVHLCPTCDKLTEKRKERCQKA